jgi:hypothetical protein
VFQETNQNYKDWTRRRELVGLVYIRYWDHVIFRDSNPSCLRPVIRECIGWLMKENEQAVYILWDRSVKKLPHERIQPRESGLIILKNDIIEMKKVV